MSEDKIDKLYKNYDTLSAATDKSEVSFSLFLLLFEEIGSHATSNIHLPITNFCFNVSHCRLSS